MNNQSVDISGIHPNIRPRACGGWIATTPPDSPLSIGVTAATEPDVRLAFRVSVERWKANIENKEAAN